MLFIHAFIKCLFVCAQVCKVAVPDSSFRYGAIQQRAQPSVQTSHPMTVHCLLHTVNWRRQRKQGFIAPESKDDCQEKLTHLIYSAAALLWRSCCNSEVRRTESLCVAAWNNSSSYRVSTDKHGLCQSSQALVDQITN